MKKTKTIWTKIVIFFIVIVLIITFHYLKILQPLEGVITYVLKPIQAVLYKYSLTISDPALLAEKEQLIKNNEDLNNQLSNLISENIELKKSFNDTKELQEQLNFLKTEPYKYQPAKVISRITTENAQIITINQGQNRDIKINMAVIAKNGIIVGKVITVNPNTAEVLLITSNATKVAAQIQNEDNTQGLIVGKHGLSLEMQLIPKQNKIEKSNIVITSGAEANITQGLIIGQVDYVQEKPNDLFNSAQIIPLIDYSQLNIVSVILS